MKELNNVMPKEDPKDLAAKLHREVLRGPQAHPPSEPEKKEKEHEEL